jgi:hypothetical protein
MANTQSTAHKDIKVLTWIVSTLGGIIICLIGWVAVQFDSRLSHVEVKQSDISITVAEVKQDVKWLVESRQEEKHRQNLGLLSQE